MPLVLTQHSSRDLNSYLDRENVIYHFPAAYAPVVRRTVVEAGDRRFIYQRPIRGAPPGQAGTYFGHGFVSDPYADVSTPGHFWLDIIDPSPLVPVPLKNSSGQYYETGTSEVVNWRGRSIRYIDPIAYFAILAAGGGLAFNEPVLPAQDTGVYAPLMSAPTDAFRPLTVVPAGTGYVPRESGIPDRFEAAALHERARADHQATLRLLTEQVHRRGGICVYNNHVDLLAKIGERRLLIEVKSLSQQSAAVHRLRYGMGQLMDYRVRYAAELAGAEPVLAFGAAPEREVGWIPEILQGNGIAFVARIDERLVAGNERARALPFLDR